MKRKRAVVLCLLLAASLLAGCGTEKFDTSAPYSFQEPEAGQAKAGDTVVTGDSYTSPAKEEDSADASGEGAVLPSDADTDAAADTSEDTAEAVLPVIDLGGSDQSEQAAAGEESGAAGLDALPTEAAGDEAAGPAEGPLSAADPDAVVVPYALEEVEPQRYASPAEEAAALGLEGERSADAEDPGEEDLVFVPGGPLGEDYAGEADTGSAAPDVAPGEDYDPEAFFNPAMQDLLFAEEVTGQAFAVAMTYWDSGYGVDKSPADPEVAWDALGWYAAWLCRTEGIELISARTAEDFLLSLGCDAAVAEDSDPEAVMRYGAPRVLRGRDGVSFDFAWHRDRLDEVLGVEAEFSVEPSGVQAVDVAVVQHFDSGLQARRIYAMTWEAFEAPDSEFSWALRSLTLPELAPEVDPALGFTWEELKEANTLENVLALFPAVRCYSDEYAENGSTWLFVRGGSPALISEGPGYCGGQYMGTWFDYEEDAAGVLRARIGAFDAEAGSWESLNGYLLQNFQDASALRLDRIEGDLIWADCLYRGGERQKLAIDRGTLVLRELLVLSEESEVLGSNVYDYSAAGPAFPFLDSWGEELRSVTVIWEDYGAGAHGRDARYTEVVSIPRDWEYLPYEARWGDYTAYNNTDYLGDYVYPGDGADYELFLTTVKG